MSSSESWRPVIGTNGRYLVSDQGRVWSTLSQKLIKQYENHKGYRKVCIIPNPAGRSKHFHVHRLLLIAFVGPPSVGMEARHLDGNPANNRLDNLKWGTRSENTYDTIRHGTHWATSTTHCKKGHEYAETGIRWQGGRKVCVECRRKNREVHRDRARERAREAWRAKPLQECPRCEKSYKNLSAHVKTMHATVAKETP